MWDIIYSVGDYKKGGMGFVVHGICAFLIYIFTFVSYIIIINANKLYLN